MAHLGLMVLVSTVVLLGGINAIKSDQPSVVRNTSSLVADAGYGNVVDSTASIYIASDVAQQLHLPVAEQVTQQVQNLRVGVTGETAGSQYLVKPAVASVGQTGTAIRSHLVQPGDTVSSVAAKYGVSAETLAWANDMTVSGTLIAGTEVRVLPANGVLHVITPSDTPEKLAAYYNANAAEIISYNDLEAGWQTGQQILIPDGKKPAVVNVASVAKFSTGNVAMYSPGNTYDFGYCTWYVKNRRPDIPNQLGNAYSWYSGAVRAGFATGALPRVGAVATERGNHVAYVEAVNADGSVTVSEMNYQGWGVRSSRTVPASTFNYIY